MIYSRKNDFNILQNIKLTLNYRNYNYGGILTSTIFRNITAFAKLVNIYQDLSTEILLQIPEYIKPHRFYNLFSLYCLQACM